MHEKRWRKQCVRDVSAISISPVMRFDQKDYGLHSSHFPDVSASLNMFGHLAIMQ